MAIALAGVVPAAAQAVHSFGVGAGGVWPRGFDARVDGDVLVENLSSSEPLLFDIGRFRGGQVFGEWNVAFNDRVEVSGGLSFYQRTVPSVYRDLVNDAGFEIAQDLKLRMAPITGIVRFLPAGRPSEFQPYIGAGVAAINWRYSEAGEFVDENFDIFAARFVETGTSLGAVFVLGARVPIEGDIYGLTLEYRYIRGQGDTGGLQNGFLG
ncbi:MAG TPA: outer membrane beta-barrel protein, partial [Vicinamibacterales bacterium]|nr:outer membrane beta-barrel protein [Vicinamibacterales bacterium]